MNITELETTLHTIVQLNPGIQEDGIIVMLSAAGFEKQTIDEAKILFRSMNVGPASQQRERILYEVPSELGLPDKERAPEIDPAPRLALLEEKNDIHEAPVASIPETFYVASVPVPQKTEEVALPQQESLLPEREVAPRTEENHIPDNLPLRPFESSPHVWPFSRYKEVFHGDVMPEEEKVVEEKPKKKVYVVPPDEEDTKLVYIAIMLFVIIVLLLGYMYALGRL